VNVLVEVRDDKEQPAGVRIRAADIILSRLYDLKQIHDFEQRINALEQRANEQTHR
jgi:hypothetical protein